MPKKHSPATIRDRSFLPRAGNWSALVRCFLLMPLFYAGLSANAQTGKDSANSPGEMTPELQDTIFVSRYAGSTTGDSADIYLSTDTNTHDISSWAASGYIISSQELRHIPPAKIRRYKAEDAFAYANDPDYWRQEKPKGLNNFNLRVPWQIFLIVCGAFLLYGVYRLSKENFSGIFQRKTRPASAGMTNEMEDELLSTDDLEKRLAEAIGAADFRAAVRLLYLKLIRSLKERQLVPAGSLPTNSAWVSVFTDPAQARQFRALAGAYEYAFYGGFRPDRTQFDDLRQRFNAFTETLPA